jgi:hypothetical protein
MTVHHMPEGYDLAIRSRSARNATGATSELIACAELMRLGFHVYRCESPAAPFDLVAYRDGRCLRVEVKTVSYKVGPDGKPLFAPTVCMPKNDEWDLLAVVGLDADVFLFEQGATAQEVRNAVRIHFGYDPMGEEFRPPCGTPAGYRWHRSHHVPLCDPCRQTGRSAA